MKRLHIPALVEQLNSLLLDIILLLPFLLVMSAPIISNKYYESVMALFSYSCHQLPERSYWVHGRQMPVCWRDFWLFLGLFLSVLPRRLFNKCALAEKAGSLFLFAYLFVLLLKLNNIEFGHIVNIYSSLVGGIGVGLVIRPLQSKAMETIYCVLQS